MTASTSAPAATRKLELFTTGQFALVQRLCAAPSPVGFEGAMIDGVILPELNSFMPPEWEVSRFVGSPGMVVDTAPNNCDALTVMFIGHADKIRLQVRSIGKDGKIWVNTDSFLPTAILGHRFDLIVEGEGANGERTYNVLPNLTAQAFGAIHLASEEVRSGRKGVEEKQVYLETGLFGKEGKERLEALGVRPGQPAIFSRRVERGPAEGTFFGSYLDNALGCFTVLEAARLLSRDPIPGVRVLFTFATHEEIGLFGSRIAAGMYRPDVVIATDVCHDLDGAPGLADKKMQKIAMGDGAVIANGTIHSYPLVSLAHQVARELKIPVQSNFAGRMEGNDSMAAVNASIDAASCSISFPIRNMHTSSELAYDGDVLAAVDLFVALVQRLSNDGWTRERFEKSHIVLDRTRTAALLPPPPAEEKK